MRDLVDRLQRQALVVGEGAERQVFYVNPDGPDAVIAINQLMIDMEQVGEMAQVCVFGITKRVCPYCRCERIEDGSE